MMVHNFFFGIGRIPDKGVKKTSVLELILPQKKPFNLSKNEDDAKLSYEVASVLSYTMQLFWPHHAVGVALYIYVIIYSLVRKIFVPNCSMPKHRTFIEKVTL